MALTYKKRRKRAEKNSIYVKIRQKLGMTQEQIAATFGVSRPYLSMIESGKRSIQSSSNITLLNMFLQFQELETGSQLSYRSLETMAFLNHEYKKVLPEMKRLEKDCRDRIKELQKEMTAMKERARDAEHAIIVFTTLIANFENNDNGGGLTQKQPGQLNGLKFFKQQAYENLLKCWEPEQAKLHGKIEAIAGEARALRRYRVKVMNEYGLKTGKR